VIWPGRLTIPTFLCGEHENGDLRSSESEASPDLRRVLDPASFFREGVSARTRMRLGLNAGFAIVW
jgi:hypothetical protein